MIREHEPNLEFHDYLTEGYHGRTGVFMTTRDSDVAADKRNQGWICKKIGGELWLRAPDISLIDITEPNRIYQMGKPTDTFSAFQYINNLKRIGALSDFINGVILSNREHFQHFDYYISEGAILEGEVRIGGNDSRILELKTDILSEVKKSSDWPRYQQEAVDYLGSTRMVAISNRNMSHFDKPSGQYIKQIDDIRRIYYPESEKIGMMVIDNAINQLPDHEVMIFIPTGCFRYITSFINRDTINRIMLWEVHFDTSCPDAIKLSVKNIENQRCLIIDKTYTGKTVTHAASLVNNEGGIPIRLGLFPKGKVAVQQSEYIMFLDRIINTKNIDVSDANWLNKTFKSVISNNQ